MTLTQTSRKTRPRTIAVLAALLLVVAGAGAFALPRGEEYRLRVLMDSAVGVYEGTPVRLNGIDVGAVITLAVQDNTAIATVSVDDAHAPLPSGTAAQVDWRSLLGERTLELEPGPVDNPALPSGSTIPSAPQVVVEDLLATLDPKTRQNLSSLIGRLQQTLDGREKQLNRTLRTGGPAVQALGEVLAAVGKDGPAIKHLVNNLHAMTSTLAARQDELAATVRNLGEVAGETAQEQQDLTDALTHLPPTLRDVTTALDKVPGAVQAATPLLQELQPVAQQLPSLAHQLSPLMQDLRPTMRALRPTLAAADVLLDHAPDLLDNTKAVLPSVTEAVRSLRPAMRFLRPYTPEIMGFVSNWGNVFSFYDSQGHYANALVTYGQSSVDGQPLNELTPGMEVNEAPLPGEYAGQPWVGANSWTDANGSRPR